MSALLNSLNKYEARTIGAHLAKRLRYVAMAGAMLLSSMGAGAADTDCAPLVSDSSNIELFYSVLDPSDAVRSARFTIQNPNAQICLYKFELVKPSPNGNTLLLPQAGVEAELSIGTGSSFDRIGYNGAKLMEVDANDGQSHEIELRLKQGAFLHPGVYRETLEFRISDGGSGAVYYEQWPINVLVTVESEGRLSIAGSQGAVAHQNEPTVHRIDFGNLSTGQRERAFLRVAANNSYTLTLRSENQGQLRHEERPDLPGIDYTVQLLGQEVKLQTPLILPHGAPKTIQANVLPLYIQIGQVERRFAGRYRDLIHIDLQVN